MKDVLTVLVILVILGLATWYVIRAKKKGKKCIGCPEGCSCDPTKGCGGCCK